SPDVDVPISTLSGDSTDTSGLFCFIFGTTTPFTPEKLLELYPTHDAYVEKVKSSAKETLEAGFVLEPESMGFIADAEKAPVPN
ncbi:MAG TPA: alpha/beta hydrolase domain-containing protein, partial [Polyangiales bacterium]|nr:alpha/beta hydrolase domain-containing protein [Polyangiales bacterium]